MFIIYMLLTFIGLSAKVLHKPIYCQTPYWVSLFLKVPQEVDWPVRYPVQTSNLKSGACRVLFVFLYFQRTKSNLKIKNPGIFDLDFFNFIIFEPMLHKKIILSRVLCIFKPPSKRNRPNWWESFTQKHQPARGNLWRVSPTWFMSKMGSWL